MADLRDLEQLTPNRGLSKHQLIKRGIEFDVYTERHSALIVPYNQVIASSINFDLLKVAALEELFVLKLEAYRDRYSSTKASKDAKDLIRIALVAGSQIPKFNYVRVSSYLTEQHFERLGRVERGAEPLALAKGNSKEAKGIRAEFLKFVSGIRATF